MPALPRVPALTLAALALLLGACATTRPADPPRELVVLVHGMGRTTMSMTPLEVALRRAGYRTLNVGYGSQGPTVAEIGADVAVAVDRSLAHEPAPAVHFVGHSLGTVVIRHLLTYDPPPRVGRAVLLAPPNRGAASADRWAPWIGWSLRPIRELRTTGGPAADLGTPPGVEIAVIAGDRDGKVAVAETCLEGAVHAVVPSRHTFIMMRPRVVRRVQAFLATGVLSAIVDQGVNLLLHFVFGVGVTLSKAIGFVLGTTTAYLINRRWTFNAAPSRARFIAVVLLYAVTFAVQVGIYTWLYQTLPDGFWYANLAFVVAQGTATVINFVVQRAVIFKIH